MIPLRKKKYHLDPADEKIIVEKYNGFNGPDLARDFGVTVYYIDVIKRKYGLVREGYRHPKKPDFNEFNKVVNIGRNGFFNVHAVENWVA